MEYLLPTKTYNPDTLSDDIGYPYVDRGANWYAVVPDGTSQAILDQITIDATNHDASQTKKQQAEQLLDTLAINEGVLFELAVIAEPFETEYRSQVIAGTIDIDPLYNAFRLLYDGLDNADKVAIQRVTQAFTPAIFPYNEPANPNNVTEDYKLEFNKNMMRFVESVLIRVGLR